MKMKTNHFSLGGYKRKYGQRTKSIPTTVSKKEATGLTFTNSECLGALTFNVGEGQTRRFAYWATGVAQNTDARLWLTPSNPALCPWLNEMAKLFEHFRWVSLRIRLVSQAAQVVGNNMGAGIVSAAIAYDPLNVAFSTAENLYNYDGSIMGKPTGDMIMNLDPGRVSASRPFFFTAAWPPTFDDASMRDLCPGWFSVVLDGVPAGPAEGAAYTTHTVWVDYTVQFAVNRNAPQVIYQKVHIYKYEYIHITIKPHPLITHAVDIPA